MVLWEFAETVNTTCVYFMIYMLIIAFSAFLVALNDFDLTTSVTAVITCINNVGPGLEAVGSVENFADFSHFSKIIFTVDMLIDLNKDINKPPINIRIILKSNTRNISIFKHIGNNLYTYKEDIIMSNINIKLDMGGGVILLT